MSEIPETPSNQVQGIPGKRRVGPSALLLAILGFLVLIAVGIMAGYFSGQGVRLDAQSTDVSMQLKSQFDLGNQALAAGEYEVARQHFQYVIDHEPNYPGVQAAYTQLLLQMNVSPTPTLSSTSEVTATPDNSSEQDTYDHLHSLLAAPPKTVDDWNAVTGLLDSLRKGDPTFHAAEIDGIYYIALRQRGIAKIFAQSCQDITLEGGIYDLTQAENFGPLDLYADDVRDAARYYITGATFWELDWNQALYYFGQVSLIAPNLMDASCQTATQRWAVASIHVGDIFFATQDYCSAATQYANAAGVNIPDNATAAPTADYADRQCNPPAQATRVVTPTGPTPTLKPTKTPKPSKTSTP